MSAAYVMPITVAGCDRDEGNREKCQKHGVSVGEIEDLFSRPVTILPDAAHSAMETRFLAITKGNSGRHVFLAFTIRERGGQHFIRPISARYMHRKEIAHFEKDNPDLSE